MNGRLAQAGVLEMREYKLRGVVKEIEVGLDSDILSITWSGQWKVLKKHRAQRKLRLFFCALERIVRPLPLPVHVQTASATMNRLDGEKTNL